MLVSAREWVRQRFDQTLNVVKTDLFALGTKSRAFEANLKPYEQDIGKFDETIPGSLEHLDILLKSAVPEELAKGR